MEEGLKAKKGYSIWSMLVIMTLLAVWLAIPRQSDQPRFSPPVAFFLMWHQVALWLLAASVIWLASGRRRAVGHVLLVIVLVLWLPLASSLLENAITGNATRTWSALHALGLHEGYGMFYQTIYRTCGYGSN